MVGENLGIECLGRGLQGIEISDESVLGPQTVYFWSDAKIHKFRRSIWCVRCILRVLPANSALIVYQAWPYFCNSLFVKFYVPSIAMI